MTAPTANWSYPTAVRFGPGRIKELADACRVAGISRPLLVTDAGLAKLPITQRTIDLLKAAGFPVAMFSDVQPNPDQNLEAGIAAFRAGGHDGVVAFGGGSGLDTGKVIAFMAGQTRPLWDFEDIGDWRTWPMRTGSPRSSPCRPRRGAAPRWAAPRHHARGDKMKKVIFHPK